MSTEDAPIYVSTRSRTGRQWYVAAEAGGYVRLEPLGTDVRAARSPKTGKWQGGVRAIVLPRRALDDPKRWRRV